MARSASGPLLNMRFRVEVDGLPGSGALEVIFPAARLGAQTRKGRRTTYGPLILKRGVGRSNDWYAWWDKARKARTVPARNVTVILLDETGANARRWAFSSSRPVAYSLSNLNSLGNEVLIETLELTIGGFESS